MKKVFVSGCCDMLHSGHVAFFEEAASYGDLYVGIACDKTVCDLKARLPIYTEEERLYMVKALRVVKDAWINKGRGLLDFTDELKSLKPDIFFVNSDGHSPLKEQFCKEMGIEYIVSKRIPHGNLPVRSTTSLLRACRIPYRIDLAGAWMDQPFVSKYYPGSVLTVSIEPDYEFNDRSGMASSSRKKAEELWQTDIPAGDREKLAKALFCFENPPGTTYITGSQDSLGIVLPGLNRLFYGGGYWPETIESVSEPELLQWIEERLWLVMLFPRQAAFDVLSDTSITEERVKRLSKAVDECWHAMLSRDVIAWGKSFSASFEAQTAMFPNMLSPEIIKELNKYKSEVLGWKVSGAGGGGYMIFVSEKPVTNAIQIRIRRF